MSFNVSVDGTTTQDINFKYTTTDVVATNGTFDNLTATNGTITNLSFNTFNPTNINTSSLVANQITTNGLVASTGNITDITSSTAHISNATIDNGTAILSTATTGISNITTANINETNNTGRIRLNYHGGDSFIFNDIGAGNLHIQSSDDNITLEPNHNNSNSGKVEIDGDLEVQHEFYLGLSTQAKIYQDINKLYIEADTNSPSGRDIFLRPQSATDVEAVKILSGFGYGLLETDKVRVDDLDFTYLGNIVDLETTLQDLTTNSITFSNGNGTALISQDNIGRLSLTSATDDIYIQPKSFGRVQINGDLKIAGGYKAIQLNTAEIDDFNSTLLIASQNKDITLRTKQGFSSEDVIIKSGLGYSQLQCNTIIANTIKVGIGVVNVGTELTSLQTQINGKQNTLTAGTNISIVGNTISSTSTLNLSATAPVNLSNNVVSVLLDTSPTLGSTNLINSGNIKNSIDLKQNVITTSSNLHFDNCDLNGHLSVVGDIYGDEVFVTGNQNTNANALTRKDYVDTQVATKQNTLTTSTNLNVNNIECNDLTTDNLKIYDIGNTILALIAHRNMASANDYTLGINQGGDTTLNVNNSGNINFTKNGNNNIATMNSTGIVIDSGKDLFRGSTSLTSDLATKQNTITASTNLSLVGSTLSVVDEPTCDKIFLTDSITINNQGATKGYVDSVGQSLQVQFPQKQDLITQSTNISAFDITAINQLVGADVLVTNSQSSVSNSLTRKDYVDTQVATKQDTLTAGTNISIVGNTISASGGGTTYTATDGVKIDGTIISADNRAIVIDDLANVYSSVSVVTAYLNGLGYSVTDINNVIPPYIQRGAFFYPRLYGASALNGRIEKTLPNFNGQLTINYGNGNVNNGFVRIYLDNVLQDTATQTEQDKTLVVDFTPNQALKLEETNSGAIIIYQIITRQRLALPVARTRLSQMSYYSRDVGSNLGTGIINFYSNTYNYILNDLGIVFTNQTDGNSSTGWLLPIGTYKIHYKYSFDNLTFNNRLGVRCRASMNGTDYQQSVGYSYGRDDNFIDKQSVQADFLYVATTATYMRLRLNCAKNNTTYASNWDNTKILAGSSVIIEKID